MSANDWKRSKQQRYTITGFFSLTLCKSEIIPEVFWREWTTSNEKNRSFHFGMFPSLACIRYYSVRLACPFIGSFSYRFRGNRCFNWTFSFKCPECRVSGTTRKLRRNEFVPKLSSKQSVEYLTHVTLQWTPDDTKITPDSNSLVVNTRQAIVIYWCQNFRSQNKVVYYSWKINEFMLSINC